MADEFGHGHAIGAGFCVDIWGAGPFIITAAGKSFRFEDSDRFGPMSVDKNGEILASRWPPERSPFWRAHRIWKRQGRRVAEDGISCLWSAAKIWRVSSRHTLIIEPGEEDGGEVEATEAEIAAWRTRAIPSADRDAGDG